MEDNIQSVYNKFVSSGYKGTEEDFRGYISEDSNIPSVYNKLVELGYKGTEDDFRGYIGMPKQQQPAQRVDVSDVEQAGRPSYEEWVKTVPQDRMDADYDLQGAYNSLPYEQMEKWRTATPEQLNDDAYHLPSVAYDEEKDEYNFLKGKNHETVQKELAWYNSDDPEAVEFRKAYQLETSGDRYKYVPRKPWQPNWMGGVGGDYNYSINQNGYQKAMPDYDFSIENATAMKERNEALGAEVEKVLASANKDLQEMEAEHNGIGTRYTRQQYDRLVKLMMSDPDKAIRKLEDPDDPFSRLKLTKEEVDGLKSLAEERKKVREYMEEYAKTEEYRQQFLPMLEEEENKRKEQKSALVDEYSNYTVEKLKESIQSGDFSRYFTPVSMKDGKPKLTLDWLMPGTSLVKDLLWDRNQSEMLYAMHNIEQASKEADMERRRLEGKDIPVVTGLLHGVDWRGLNPLVDLRDATVQLGLSQKTKNGEELSGLEQEVMQTLDDKAKADMLYGNNYTVWDRLGTQLPEQLMFTLSFILSGGITGATEAGERVAAKAALKAAARRAERGATGKFGTFVTEKVVPKTLGMATGATIQTFASPISWPSIAADFEKRYAGDVYYDKDGNLHVFDNGVSAPKALYQAAASAWIENFTEFAGENITKTAKLVDSKLLDVSGAVDDLMKKTGMKRIYDVVSNPIPGNLGKLAQKGSNLEEFSEEILGSIMNTLFATDQKAGQSYSDAVKESVSNAFSQDQLLETFLSCTLTGMVLGGGGMARNAIATRDQRKAINRQVETSRAILSKVNGIDIDELDNQIENSEIKDLSKWMKQQSDANGWSADEQGAVISYVLGKTRQTMMRFNDESAIQQEMEELRKQAESMRNVDDGTIYNAMWDDGSGTEQPVNIVSGRVRYNTNEDGSMSFDPYTSSGMLIVRLPDGTMKQVSSRSIKSLESQTTVDELLEAQGNTVPQAIRRQFEEDGMAVPTVESVWGGAPMPGVTALNNGKLVYIGNDNGEYVFSNKDEATKKDMPEVRLSERQMVEIGLGAKIDDAIARGDIEAKLEADSDMDFLRKMDEASEEVTEKKMWDYVTHLAASMVKTDEEGNVVFDDGNVGAYAAYLLARSNGAHDVAMAEIRKAIEARQAQLALVETVQGIDPDGNITSLQATTAEAMDHLLAIDFYQKALRNLEQKKASDENVQAAAESEVEEDRNEEAANTPVSQMEVGTEFPVDWNGTQAVAVVDGRDADGRNLVTVYDANDRDGLPLQAGIEVSENDDAEWEARRVRPQEHTEQPMESAGNGTEQVQPEPAPQPEPTQTPNPEPAPIPTQSDMQPSMEVPRDNDGNIDYGQITDPAVYAQGLQEEFGEEAADVINDLIAEETEALNKAGEKKNAIERRRAQKESQGKLDIYNKVKGLLGPQEEVEKYPLSEEKDEFGKPFIKAADGSTIFGEVNGYEGMVDAPIKLSLGENYKDEKGDNHGYGMLHIEAGHGKQIREAGFATIEEFVEQVAKNYQTVREGGVVAGNQTYLLEISDGHNNTLFIQLSRDGNYWNINSAGIFKEKYSRRKPEVGTRPALEPGTTADSSGVNNGETGAEPSPAGNSPTTSDGKDTEISETASEKQENISETSKTPMESAGEGTEQTEEPEQELEQPTEEIQEQPTEKKKPKPKKQTDFQQRIDAVGEPRTLEEAILLDIARGGAKFRWGNRDEDKTVTKRGIGDLWKYSQSEFKKRIGILRKDGYSIETYAEAIQAGQLAYLGGHVSQLAERMDMRDLVDAIEDVLHFATSSTEALEAIETKRNEEAEEEQRMIRNAMDVEAKEQGFENWDDKEAYIKSLEENILTDADYDEITRIFAEQNQEDGQRRRTIESEGDSAENQPDERQGVRGADEGSTEVLQGTQAADTGTTEPAGQGTRGESGDIQDAGTPGKNEGAREVRAEIDKLKAQRANLVKQLNDLQKRYENANGLFGDTQADEGDLFGGQNFLSPELAQTTIEGYKRQIKQIDEKIAKLEASLKRASSVKQTEIGGEETPKAEPKKPQGAATENTIFTEDEYQRRKEALKRRHRTELNIAINPQDFEDLLYMAGYHIERGVRKFADFCKSMIEDLGDWVRPYLQTVYLGAKADDDIKKLGIDRKEWSSEDEVLDFDVDNFDKQQESETGAHQYTDQQKRKFSDAVRVDMRMALERGEKPYRSINDIRKRAESLGMEVDSEGRDDIMLQELVEDGLVRAAREVVESGRYGGAKSRDAFDAICQLYEMQPTISRRSANRVKMQQYSTPLPMSFVADMFAYRRGQKSVLEPTAGNGMLVFAVPAGVVTANELDETRLANLREQGFDRVLNRDATDFDFGGPFDAVIGNPPFGSAEAKEYDGVMIGGLEEQIVLNALQAMADNGRAAFIIGGNMEYAKNGGIAGNKAFWTYLYNHYNVKGVVDMDGKMYSRQGTTYPTRMILIEGRRSAEEIAQSTIYPPVKEKSLRKAESFVDLYDIVKELNDSTNKTNGHEVLRGEGSPRVPNANNTPGQTGTTRPGSQYHANDTDEREGLGETVGGRSTTGTRPNAEGTTQTPAGTGGVESGLRGGTEGISQTQQHQGWTGANSVSGNTGRTGADVVSGVHGSGSALHGVGPRSQQPEIRQQQPKEQEKRTLTEEKLSYRQHSGSKSLGSVAPAAMVEAMDRVLSEIEKTYGKTIDEFVKDELGYDSYEALYKALAAEQIDSVAMAIHQMKQGNGMVIGDQTGVGKGRQMAALIRWAHNQGKKPIFFTKKPELFSAIYEDLIDIGSKELRPFIINEKGAIKVKGKVVYRPLTGEALDKVLRSGEVPEGYDFVVINYDQVNTGDSVSREEARRSGHRVGDPKKATPKADYIRRIASDNYLLLDESHMGAGQSNTGFFMQSIVRICKGVTFASATFAKRPDTMPLYAIRTAMSKANLNPDELIGVIEKGGVTLQEIMSRALTEAGQYVRRERDMSDVRTDWETVSDPETSRRAREKYDLTIKAFNAIIDFQRRYVTPKIKQLSEELAETASSADTRRGTEDAGVKNTPFASKTYNYSKQLMLALKVDAIVDKVIAEIKAGRHPVIALENTMGSFLDDFANGDVIKEPTFSMSLLRGLESVMQYTVTNPGGERVPQSFKPSDLGAEGENAYYELQKLIRESTKGIFISPLDAIIEKLNQAGYKVGELTGRTQIVERDDSGRVVVRNRKDKDPISIMDRFNDGSLDVLIINKAGSTGISIHASEKFSNQRQRTMIIAQPLSDINDYMQMIGRIDRTGQVHRGYYINLGLPVPAENRFLMMLATKLKSLNANTTTSQESESNSVEAPDILNKYGSQVVVEYLRDNPEIYVKMGEPIGKSNDRVSVDELDGYEVPEDDSVIRKVTGYVALLSIKEQEEFYNDVVRRYNDLIKYLDDTGQNDLKITVMPLRAKTLEKKVASPGADQNGSNPFAKDAFMETVEIDVLRKPMKADEVRKAIESLNTPKGTEKGHFPTAAADNTFGDRVLEILGIVQRETQAKLRDEEKRYEESKKIALEDIAKKSDKIRAQQKLSAEEKEQAIADYVAERNAQVEQQHERAVARIQEAERTMQSRLGMFVAGSSYLMPDQLNDAQLSSPELASPAIFLGYKAKESKVTPSTTFAVFATLDGRRRIELKLSDAALFTIRNMTRENYDLANRVTLDNWDSELPTSTRKNAIIMTGNILQAVAATQDENGNYPGQLISYTDENGDVHDGILMPDKWKPTMMKNSGVPISARLSQIEQGKSVASTDGKVTITKSRWSGSWLLTVPKSKKEGAVYFENPVILKVVGGFWQSRGQFAADINSVEDLRTVVNELANIGVKVTTGEQNGGVELSVSNDDRPSIENTESQRIAFEAATTALERAGYEVVRATEEDIENLKKENKLLRKINGTINGWLGKDGKIYLTESGLNAETAVHEYTHLWAEALQLNDPKLWGEIKTLLKGTPTWNEVKNNPAYAKYDEDRLAEEVLAHLSGRDNGARMEAEAKRMIDEADTMADAAKAASMLNRLKEALKKFWTWVGKNLFGIKGKIDLDTVENMILADLVNGVNPFGPSGGRRRNATEQSLSDMVFNTFVSNAARAVENIKQDKATPEQWLAMLKKNGGLKEAEDKWLGLSQWLQSQDKKSLTKDEVLDFINENAIRIEEVNYSEAPTSQTEERESLLVDEVPEPMRERMGELNDEYKKLVAEERKKGQDVWNARFDAFRTIAEKYGNNFSNVFGIHGGELSVRNGGELKQAAKILGVEIEETINPTRLKYTTEGLENKREIALTVPTIEPWNESDEIHFGDAGKGRAVAWIRFGETTDADGNRVLVIDEIQSKRHQEGREKGYKKGTKEDVRKANEATVDAQIHYDTYISDLAEKYNCDRADVYAHATDSEIEEAEARMDAVSATMRAYEQVYEEANGVPAAPFEKNWMELAMKRMLRYAAENGYDKVAWTTGEQQAERYDLSKVIDEIAYWKDGDNYGISAGDKTDSQKIDQQTFTPQELVETFGKEIADKIINDEGVEESVLGYPKDTDVRYINGESIKVGGEGMKGFYDKMLVSFMNKYGKQWGVKVGEVTLPNVEEAGRKMWAVDVNDAMRESVMRGQPMFSFTPSQPQNSIADEYNRMTGANVDDVNSVKRGWEKFVRDQFDGLRPLEQMQQLIEKALGRKLRDSEKAYELATQLTSKTGQQIDREQLSYIVPVLQNVTEAIKSLKREGYTTDEAYKMVTNYLLAKHGLERNEWFEKQGRKEGDYAGLRGLAESLGENPDDFKAVAERIVSEFEQDHDTKELWKSLKALSDRMLEISYNTGMIDKETFEELKKRHKYYVPLRGFADGTAADLFDYVAQSPHFQNIFKKATGRNSMADDPLANLMSMLHSAIVIGNQNEVMQKIYNLAVNSKSDLLRVTKPWYVYDDATDTWEEKYPDIPEDATADEIDAIVKQFDADMQQKQQQGKAKRKLNRIDVGKKLLPYQAREHEMVAYIDGKRVVMHVAGNPLVAQAMNRSNTQQLNKVMQAIQTATRWYSSINTSWSPAFGPKNAMRDIRMMLFGAYVTGGIRKMWQSSKDVVKAGWALPRLLVTGKMDGGLVKALGPQKAAQLEQWWNEFIENGGETGFTRTLNAEKAKGEVRDMIGHMLNGSKDGENRVRKYTIGLLDWIGRYSEDISRFAAYCQQRAQGESVLSSIQEAKNVTVNFNVKGGSDLAANMRAMYSFFNASMQGINRMRRLATEHPKRFSAGIAAMMLGGAVLPWLNMALFAMLGGDDDDWRKYEELSEYTANHNMIIYVGNHKFVSIPWSQELAPFNALGNIWFRQQMGWNKGKSVAEQWGDMFVDLSPVSVASGNKPGVGLVKTIMPSFTTPVWEALFNEDFTGAPLYKDNRWNQYDAGWEKAYEGKTSKSVIDASRWLDERTGIDINPAIAEHLFSGVLGGLGRSGDKLLRYFSNGFQLQDAPFIRTMMFDSKKQGYIGAVQREYGRNAYEVLPEMKAKAEKADAMEYARLVNTEEYKIADVVSRYKTGKDLEGNKTGEVGIDKMEKEYKKVAGMSDGSEEYREQLEELRLQITERKIEMLDEIQQVKYENSGDLRRYIMDVVNEVERKSKERNGD